MTNTATRVRERGGTVKTFLGRDKYDWVAISIVSYIAIVIGLICTSCETAKADDGLEIVYQSIALESASEPQSGQVAVASVILNRSRERWQTLEQVCLARKQFSAWNDPGWAKAWLDRHYTPKVREKAVSALNKAIVGGDKHIDHYHTRQVMPYWAKGQKPSLTIGKHVFYNLEGAK